MYMLKQVKHRANTIKELLRFFWRERLWWMIPFVVVLVIVALLLIFAQSSPIIPFLYTAF